MEFATDRPRPRIRKQFAEARAIGAGILGQAAEQGGADFVLALNAC